MNQEEAYQEILKVLEKHEDLIKDDYPIDIRSMLSNRIELEKISSEFGIDIQGKGSRTDYVRLGDYEVIVYFGDKRAIKIAHPDDGKQPKCERLYNICFPTGPYIFGEEYPTSTFQSFFNELKDYKPKYIDSANHSLYFTSETAKTVHNDFKDIYNKYKKLVSVELKAKKIIALKDELSKLESSEPIDEEK
jgi:hypothetical protein